MTIESGIPPQPELDMNHPLLFIAETGRRVRESSIATAQLAQEFDDEIRATNAFSGVILATSRLDDFPVTHTFTFLIRNPEVPITPASVFKLQIMFDSIIRSLPPHRSSGFLKYIDPKVTSIESILKKIHGSPEGKVVYEEMF